MVGIIVAEIEEMKAIENIMSNIEIKSIYEYKVVIGNKWRRKSKCCKNHSNFN